MVAHLYETEGMKPEHLSTLMDSELVKMTSSEEGFICDKGKALQFISSENGDIEGVILTTTNDLRKPWNDFVQQQDVTGLTNLRAVRQ
eukprot:2895457-Rhodomonas_salina.1